METWIFKFTKAAFAAYIIVLSLLYLFQERLMFHPRKLATEHKFEFRLPFEEINLDVENAVLNGLRFRVKEPKGAILFFHGNSGSLKYWGNLSEFFTTLGYDFYVFDYRGFGKSDGKISSEDRFYNDSDEMMRYVLKDFKRDQIIPIGFSIGSGLAARVAQKFDTKELVLISPYFKFDELAKQKIPIVPKFLVRYKIPTANFVKDAKNTRVTIFHGKFDSLIDISHSHKLSQILKPNDAFYELEAEHNDMIDNKNFQDIMRERF